MNGQEITVVYRWTAKPGKRAELALRLAESLAALAQGDERRTVLEGAIAELEALPEPPAEALEALRTALAE